VLTWVVVPASEVMVPRDLTLSEIQAVCEPSVTEKEEAIETLETQTEQLRAKVADRQAKVKELESEMAQRSQRGRALVAELERTKSELEQAKMELAVAEAEKRRLAAELTVTQDRLASTEEALDDQITSTAIAREDALANKWHRFLNDAQLDICEKGNRKKLGTCREAVLAKLSRGEVQNAFSHCVRSRQATPGVLELEDEGAMPTFTYWINQEDRVLRGWAVHLCDPTLPEAEDFLQEQHLPTSQHAAVLPRL
jgi:hypothetical protein